MQNPNSPTRPRSWSLSAKGTRDLGLVEMALMFRAPARPVQAQQTFAVLAILQPANATQAILQPANAAQAVLQPANATLAPLVDRASVDKTGRKLACSLKRAWEQPLHNPVVGLAAGKGGVRYGRRQALKECKTQTRLPGPGAGLSRRKGHGTWAVRLWHWYYGRLQGRYRRNIPLP